MMTTSLKLSVLDLIPVRSRQSSADALAASIDLAQHADALGYTRYWVAEHHNMPAVASTNTPVAIATLAARTTRIRVGSGGLMLPNHAPLVVAEQFALLEAAAPGRIDLGLGRAPGSDPVVTAVLHRSGLTSDVNAFPNSINDIAAMLTPDGATVSLTSGTEYQLKATPAAASVPEIWLLGSSDYSATLAAAMGLPYVYAHHFSGDGSDRALSIYRSQFEPSRLLDKPRTLITANVAVASTADDAMELALPLLQQYVRLRTNQKMSAQSTVEEGRDVVLQAGHQHMLNDMASSWIIDDAKNAARRVTELADRFEVDEVMVSPNTSAFNADDLRLAPSRVRALEMLAEHLL